MPRRKGRKNPTPKKVSRAEDENEENETFPDPNLNLPDDPNERLKLLRQTPITSLFRENEVGGWENFECKSEDLSCPRCQKQYTTFKGVKYHVQNVCPKYCRNKYTCLVCGGEFKELAEIQAHISVLHVQPESYEVPARSRRSTRTRNYESVFESVENTDDFTEEEDALDEEFVIDVEDIASPDDEVDAFVDMSPERPSRKSRSRNTKTKAKTKMGHTGFSFAKIDEPLVEAMSWSYELLSDLSEKYKEVLPDLMPKSSDYKSNLTLEEFEYCGGKVTASLPFTIEREKTRKTESAPTRSAGLQPFTSLPAENTHQRHDLTFCASGPVWAMSWCPSPLKSTGLKQYLAVSVHDDTHTITQCYNEPGIIQIWDCGVLSIHGHNNETPKLAAGYSHYDGPVWDLKWCPLGGRLTVDDKDKMDRIGVLGAACGSGKILLISVPEPEIIAGEKSPDSPQKLNLFRAKPNLVLLPSAQFYEVIDEHQVDRAFGQCFCLDWSLSDGCKWVAGGYARGIVALWKVANPSQLLLQKSQFEGTELVACRAFRAHSKAVRGISWCPFKESTLATGGMDRFLKVWDTDNPEMPVCVSNWKGSAYIEVEWPLLWCGVYAATEEVFSGPSYHGALYHDALQDYMAPMAAIPFKSVCWSVSSSTWLNLLAGCDPCGEVVVFTCSNWSRKTQGKKLVSRIQLFSTSLQQESADLERATPQDGSKEQNGAGSVLTLKDADLTNLSRHAKRKCCENVKMFDRFPPTDCGGPLLRSVNCVRWNPNFGSHTWIASGTQCGLVRLHCIDAIHNGPADTAFYNCAT